MLINQGGEIKDLEARLSTCFTVVVVVAEFEMTATENVKYF